MREPVKPKVPTILEVIMIILFVFVLVQLFFMIPACTKCVDCTTTITTKVTWTQSGHSAGQPSTTTATFTECGSSKEIENVQGTTTATAVNGPYTATSTSKTTCQ